MYRTFLISTLMVACVSPTAPVANDDAGTNPQPQTDAGTPDTQTMPDAALPDVAPPPPWSPKDLSGLALWLRATDGLHVDGSDNVTAWDDQSGLNNTATPTAGGVPKHTVFAGHDALQFSGKQAMQMNDAVSLRWNGDFTVVVVAASTQPGMTYGMLYGKSAAPYPYAGPALMVDYPAGKTPYTGSIGGQVDINDAVVSTETGLDDNTLRAIGLVRSSSSLFVHVDDGAAAALAMVSPPQDTTGMGAIAWVGGHPANGSVVQGFQGVILEVIGVAGALSAPQYAQVWAYVSQRYGL